MMEAGGERRGLWVFVDGQAAPAEIQVDLQHNIHGLKKVIKAECDLHDVVPSNMILWKVSLLSYRLANTFRLTLHV
jgi:hypothetical protein